MSSTPKPLPVLPDFMNEHAPRHEPLERLRALAASDDAATALREFAGTFSETADLPEDPPNLIAMYLGRDVRRLVQDVAIRPDHYEARQRRLIDHLHTGREVNPPPTHAELDALFLTFLRPTAVREATEQASRRISGAREGAEGPGGGRAEREASVRDASPDSGYEILI